MEDKKIKKLIIILSIVLGILVLIILLPLGKKGEVKQSRIPEDVDVFDYELKEPVTCYLANEEVINFVREQLSEFPSLKVEDILFRTEDFEIFHAVVEYEDRLIGIILDTKTGEMVWNISEQSLTDILPEGPVDGGGV